MENLSNLDEDQILLSSTYANANVPITVCETTVAERPANPLKSYVLRYTLEGLFASIDKSKGMHTILSENAFISGMTNLVIIAIAEQNSMKVEGPYISKLVNDTRVKIPAQIQYVLTRCTIHQDENYQGTYVLSGDSKETYDTWNVEEECDKIVKVFKALNTFQRASRIPFRLAETIPSAKYIVADDSFKAWVVEDENNITRSSVMVPYPKFAPVKTALAAMLNAGTCEALDSSAYRLKSDTVGELAKGIS